MRKKPLICICGKSGTGKTTLVKASPLKEIVSYTTRDMREGEIDGVDYHFRTREWMLENRDKFNFDWKEFGGSLYGATDSDIEDLDIIVITLDSAIELRELGFPVYIIWIKGRVRSDRNRNIDVHMSDDMKHEVDYCMTNDCDIASLVDELMAVAGNIGVT